MISTGLRFVWFVTTVIVLQTEESLQTNKNLSYDVANDDRDANPEQATSHGTKCAGIIAAKRNGICRTGISFNAEIAGLKINNGSFANDELTAAGLKHEKDKIHIYSNSWGPIDNGFTVKGPGLFVQQALEDGAKQGRNGRGSIFVFPSGNGGIYEDSCAFDGYVNSIYTIAIGAVSKSGSIPRYAESCSSVMAAAYGDGMQTCDTNGRCVFRFARTSAATAVASGIFALLLEANSQLTWRDVQHLIVRTSNPKLEITGGKGWIINGAGLMVHPSLGFGIMDAEKLVDQAKNNWQKVPDQKHCSIQFNERKLRKLFHRGKPSFKIPTVKKKGCLKIKYIEHVQVEMSLNFAPRGLLEMYLISPQGTKSQLIYPRVYDALTRRKTYKDLVITSIHFWGENPTVGKGNWKLTFHSASFNRGAKGKISKFNITFYGTEKDPMADNGLPKGIKTCKYKNTTKNIWKGYGSKCCGTMGLFDKNVVRCCNSGKLVEKDSVCGIKPYNKCTQICCAGNIYEKIEGVTSCCGDKTYNTKIQICCNEISTQKHICHSSYKYVARCTQHRSHYELTYPLERCSVSSCKDKSWSAHCRYWKEQQ